MQSKLNEILELCIEKSVGDVFYSFAYNNLTNYIWVQKFNEKNRMINFNSSDKNFFMVTTNEIDKALEYMQNE